MKNTSKSLLFCCMISLLMTSAQAQTVPADKTPKYTYEQPTMKRLSQLYWAISKMDIENDVHIDNFMLINECDIYQDYYYNEFEWREVRQATRHFIETHKKTFPLRFEFMQPIKLKDYDIKNQRFEIMDEYKINGTRRFEMMASDYLVPVCGKNQNIEGYPKGVVLELSRPFAMQYLTTDPKTAEAYIAEKLKNFKSLPINYQTEEKLYDTRNAYVVMKVKIFSAKDSIGLQNGWILLNVMGVLEGVEVYADQKKTTLLYSENLRRRSAPKKNILAPAPLKTPELTAPATAPPAEIEAPATTADPAAQPAPAKERARLN